MNAVANILNKHLGAVHNSSPLSMVQRKAFNILLKTAEKEINADIEHIISFRELMQGIGWSAASKTPENLKECLNELVSIKIQWNIFEADKKSKWVTSTLLASAAVKDGYVYYTFSLPLRELLSKPNVYAKLDLGIQKLFKVKYSLLIWEYISGELSSKKTDSIVTKWLTYDQILKLTYLEGSAYEKRYSLFLERVLEKSLGEINTKSDVTVTYKTKSEKGRITHICFHAVKKETKQLLIDLFKGEDIVDDELTYTLKQIGIPNEVITDIKKTYSEERIQNALEFFLAEFEQSKINNPIAFFNKALKEGWVIPQVMNKRISNLEVERTDEDDSSIEEQIEYQSEPELIKTLRRQILKKMGRAVYENWFHPLKFRQAENTFFVEAPTAFVRDRIEAHYREDFCRVVTNCLKNPDIRIEFNLINEKGRVLA